MSARQNNEQHVPLLKEAKGDMYLQKRTERVREKKRGGQGSLQALKEKSLKQACYPVYAGSGAEDERDHRFAGQ